MITKEQIIEYLDNLNQIELKELINQLPFLYDPQKEPFGAFPFFMDYRAAPAYGCPPFHRAPEIEEFQLILKDVGPNKIVVAKAIKELMDEPFRGLVEKMKTLPWHFKKILYKWEINEIKSKFESLGATVEIAKELHV